MGTSSKLVPNVSHDRPIVGGNPQCRGGRSGVGKSQPQSALQIWHIRFQVTYERSNSILCLQPSVHWPTIQRNFSFVLMSKAGRSNETRFSEFLPLTARQRASGCSRCQGFDPHGNGAVSESPGG